MGMYMYMQMDNRHKGATCDYIDGIVAYRKMQCNKVSLPFTRWAHTN